MIRACVVILVACAMAGTVYSNPYVEGQKGEGLVTADWSRGIPGVEVQFRDMENNTIATSVTGKDGIFLMPALEGRQEVQVSHPAFYTQTLILEPGDQIDFALDGRLLQVEGVIRNATGPFAGDVWLGGEQLNLTNGHFSVELVAGAYELHAILQGHENRPKQVLLADEQVSWTIDSYQEHLVNHTGMVVDEFGQPISNVFMRFDASSSQFWHQWFDVWEAREQLRETLSLPDGSFSIQLPPGKHSYTMWRGGFETILGNGTAQSGVTYVLPTPPETVDEPQPEPDSEEAAEETSQKQAPAPLVLHLLGLGLLLQRIRK